MEYVMPRFASTRSTAKSIGGGVSEISLSSSHVALVDDADVEKLMCMNWFASLTAESRTVYARGRLPGMKGRSAWHMHRVILCFPVMCVDHINHNGLDNRRCNLRLSTHAQNCRNAAIKNVRKTSRFKGVYLSGARWVASIKHNKLLINLGSYIEEVDAACAYDAASLILHGEFGVRNFETQCNDRFSQTVSFRIAKALTRKAS